MENHTAKHFVLQLGSLVCLYLSLSFLLVLLFGLISLRFPDATDAFWQIEQASSSVRLGIAMVIVFFPTYLIITRQVNNLRRREPSGHYLTITKWLIYLSLLIGGVVLLGDLVAVIRQFLEGEITERFILKATAVLIVVGAAFSYYVLDARGYWIQQPRRSIAFGGVSALLVLTIIVLGFLSIEPPAEVREQRLDSVQVRDLQNIQHHIENYLVLNDTLPESLEDLEAVSLPTAPEDRPAYRYEITERGFQLCASFAEASPSNETPMLAPTRPKQESPHIINQGDWQHEAGDYCFDRIVENTD